MEKLICGFFLDFIIYNRTKCWKRCRGFWETPAYRGEVWCSDVLLRDDEEVKVLCVFVMQVRFWAPGPSVKWWRPQRWVWRRMTTSLRWPWKCWSVSLLNRNTRWWWWCKTLLHHKYLPPPEEFHFFPGFASSFFLPLFLPLPLPLYCGKTILLLLFYSFIRCFSPGNQDFQHLL